ncbi:MAG TPA: HAMP domain-containing sensor histidine kinase [Acidimicrobiia bacterium]|nr:HAMP domain-containing sensor histidine kinase [Acidimicrobiia bacterium]
MAVASGVVMIAAALTARGRSRIAWSLIGFGILCWGIGRVAWEIQTQAGEIPYHGPADFFYVAGYPFIFAGVIALPYLVPGRFERIRLAIDATAGALSLAVVMWVTYLHDVVGLGIDPIESFLNVAYPFGDVLLVTALMVLAMRRSEQRLDLRIVLLAGAVALTAVADVIFSLQSSAGTYVDFAWLDGLWVLSYGMIGLAAWVVTKRPAVRETSYRSSTIWQLVAPYTAVATLFLVRLVAIDGNDFLLNVATTIVAVLIILRQNLAVREKAELLARQRDDLVASVSHELRTPLTGIQGYADILSESWAILSDNERTEMLATINGQAGQLGLIVKDLIDVARDRLQNVNLDREAYNASDIVNEAAATLGSGTGIQVETKNEEALVWADPYRVRQVLTNLMTNALRYGRSEILVTSAQTGDFVTFAVHDNGDGVPSKYQADIWDRFERGLYNHDHTKQGSGIGLSVARDLVTGHGGTITYRTSEILGGACFEFTIPGPDSDTADLVSATSESAT